MNRDYYRQVYDGHLWPAWYRIQAVKRRNTDLVKCCGQCQAIVDSWKAKPAQTEAK